MPDNGTAAYRFIVGLGRPLLLAFTKRDWRGAHHIPREGGVILVSNHTSNFDPLAVGHFIIDGAHRVPRFLGKAEVVAMPVFGKLFQAAGQIPVYRGTATAVNAYRDAIAALEDGQCIALYPEGTVTKDPDLWPMMAKTGAARMALATGAPVVPIAQWGPHEVMPDKGRFHISLLPRHTMHIHAGEPINLDDLRGVEITAEVLAEATERIMLALTMLLAEIRGELPPAERYNPRRPRSSQ